MRKTNLFLCIAASTAFAISACAKQSTKEATDPLTYVPADTPYVLANLEPVPKAQIDEWFIKLQPFFDQYGQLLETILHDDPLIKKAMNGADNTTGGKLISAFVDEIKTHNTVEKWRELGYKPDMRIAMYGVGLMPVFRVELSDAEAFKATISRIETKVGEKLLTGKVGNQEYWLVDGAKMQLLFGIQGNQLVLGAAPKNASEELRKQLFGITRPTKNLLDSGKLAELNKKYNYTPYASGYIDIRHIGALIIGEHSKTDEEFVIGVGGSFPERDPVCAKEMDAMLNHYPRMVFGYNEFSTKRMVMDGKLELEPELAKDLMATFSNPMPGMGAKGEGLLDFTMSIPLLKLKDFALKQVQLVIDKPFQCKFLAKFNDEASKIKTNLDQTVPPPASDIMGMRITLSHLALKEGMKPEFSGKVLLAINNPMVLTGMAQMMVPELKDFKITTDSKPVALPNDPKIPAEYGPIYVAMNDKAIAASIGKGEETGLADYLAAPSAQQPTFFRMGFDGAIYDFYGQLFEQMAALKGGEEKETPKQLLDFQKKMFQMYKLFIKRADFTVSVDANGINITEVMEMP